MSMSETECQQLDRILESTVIVSWPELMAESESGSVHVEYDFGPKSEITFVRIWLSETRGVWHLVCSYSVSTSGPRKSHIQFENGYVSERLAETLNFAIQHQDIFLPPPNLGRQGLLQIGSPSEKERAAAITLIDEAFHVVRSRNDEPLLV